jgi:hypothetical protein
MPRNIAHRWMEHPHMTTFTTKPELEYPHMNDYKVDEHGIIRSPGKFEGEPSWVPEYWGMVLEGMSDESFEVGNGVEVDIFILDGNDDLVETDGYYAVALWENEMGFVYHATFNNEQELKEFRGEG